MQVLGVHHAQITVEPADVERARAFYCGVLGLTEVPKPAVLAARGGFWLQLGAVQIHVSVEAGVDRTKTKAHVAYQVDDLDGWRDRLAAQGIIVKPGEDIPGFARFELRDPFGNRVEMLQARTHAAP